MSLNELTKEQLLDLAHDMIYFQEKYYRKMEAKELNANDAFYQLAGSVQIIRLRYNLPPLYDINKYTI